MERIKEMIRVYTTGKTTSNFDKSNEESKLGFLQFISFLLLID